MDVVEAFARRDPVTAAIHFTRDLVRLVRQEVVLLAAPLTKLARAEWQELFLPEQRRVQLLADRVVAGAACEVLLKKGRELLVGLRCGRARHRDLFTGAGLRDLRRHELARVPRGSLRLADGALGVDAGHEREVDVGLARGHVTRGGLQAHARGVGELAVGTQTMEEEDEHALERRVEVGVRLTAPVQTRAHELAPAQRREDGVAIDALGGVEVLVAESAETREPRGDLFIPPAEGLGRQVLGTLVVFREPEHAGPARGLVVALLQIVANERRERRRRHDRTSGTMAEDPE